MTLKACFDRHGNGRSIPVIVGYRPAEAAGLAVNKSVVNGAARGTPELRTTCLAAQLGDTGYHAAAVVR